MRDRHEMYAIVTHIPGHAPATGSLSSLQGGKMRGKIPWVETQLHERLWERQRAERQRVLRSAAGPCCRNVSLECVDGGSGGQ